MALGRWVGILDPAVLKVGMKVKSCLDMASCEYEEDSEGENQLHWFTGKIHHLEEPDEGEGLIQVNIYRDDFGGDGWGIVLNEENLEYFKIWVISDWDD